MFLLYTYIKLTTKNSILTISSRNGKIDTVEMSQKGPKPFAVVRLNIRFSDVWLMYSDDYHVTNVIRDVTSFR